jgi:hypothetical protein
MVLPDQGLPEPTAQSFSGSDWEESMDKNEGSEGPALWKQGQFHCGLGLVPWCSRVSLDVGAHLGPE